MPANPNLVLNDGLTQYAQFIAPDWKKAMAEALGIAPVVPTGAMAGRYAKFNNRQAFLVPDARRASGGETATAQFAGEMVDFILDPNALKIAVDQEIEVPLAGGTSTLLEQAKTRTLLSQGANAFSVAVFDTVLAAVAAKAGKGAWGDAAKDPMAELEEALDEVEGKTGLTPNVVSISKPMWRLLKKHPKTLARFPGKSAAITPQLVAEEIGDGDLSVEIVSGRGFRSGNIGTKAATTVPFMGNSALVHYRDPMPTQFSPGFAATLAMDSNMLEGVYEYMSDDGAVKYLRTKWRIKTVVQSALLCCRIDLSA